MDSGTGIGDGVDMLTLCRPVIREPDVIAGWDEGNKKPAVCIWPGRWDGLIDNGIRCRLAGPRSAPGNFHCRDDC